MTDWCDPDACYSPDHERELCPTKKAVCLAERLNDVAECLNMAMSLLSEAREYLDRVPDHKETDVLKSVCLVQIRAAEHIVDDLLDYSEALVDASFWALMDDPEYFKECEDE